MCQVDQSVRSRHVDTESLNGGEACDLAVYAKSMHCKYANIKYLYVRCIPYYIYIYRLLVTVNYRHSESQFCSSKVFTDSEVKAVPRRQDPVEVLNPNPASTRGLGCIR